MTCMDFGGGFALLGMALCEGLFAWLGMALCGGFA